MTHTSIPTPSARPRALDKRGILAFVALAFGLTWAIEIAALAMGMRFSRVGATETLLLAGVMFIPALSAFVVRRFVTREGFGDAGLRLGPWRLYIAVWLGVPLLVAVIYGLSALFGVARFDWTLQTTLAQLQELAPDKPLPAAPVLVGMALASTMTMGLLITCVATFGEEFGWTGYLLPRLLPLGKWRAALLYGLVWGLWHAPVIWGGFNYPGYPLSGVAMMCVFTIVLALIQTALRLRSGSVLLTSFFHASINSQARGVIVLVAASVHPLLGGLLGATGLAVFGLVGAFLLARTPDPAGNPG